MESHNRDIYTDDVMQPSVYQIHIKEGIWTAVRFAEG